MVGTVEGGQSQKAEVGLFKKNLSVFFFPLSCQMSAFRSSVCVEEKCQCLSDVVWSELPICRLNCKIEKVLRPPAPCLCVPCLRNKALPELSKPRANYEML